jgi:hypothetical protein
MENFFPPPTAIVTRGQSLVPCSFGRLSCLKIFLTKYILPSLDKIYPKIDPSGSETAKSPYSNVKPLESIPAQKLPLEE